jgi:hypothetical protein
MSFLGALLMILSGLAIMGFGLFLYYAWLPLLYGLVGFDIGLLLGRWLTGGVEMVAILLGIALAIVLAVLSFTLHPYRRVLLGLSGGFLLGLSIAAVFGLESGLGGFLGILLAVACAVIGAILVPRYMDTFIVIASAASGAAMIVGGAHLLFPGIGLFDVTTGTVMARLLTVVLTLIGIGWQYSNITKWIHPEPMPH